ncbi:hypothetical protein [Flavobacterium pallidum]|uniref:Uncharacterized protein n=1 Tax=Flavobacterium pallidum TaxID=2172098 RepID=A0A2S1SK74_9FLAO|nr:hypothetical protein [Flavobacterium pallidum]AWI26771.1 hypothetical protein HYN49_13185 [Flavobacterium pallidum]
MTFKQTDVQKFDSSGNFILAEEYVLSYLYSDGWTERLLSIGIFIDIYYASKIDLNYYLKSERCESVIESEIPQKIKDLIIKLRAQDIVLKQNYADTFMEDSKREHFVINQNGKSHNCSIGILTKKIVAENESEKLLFLLQKELEKWREEIYCICNIK